MKLGIYCRISSLKEDGKDRSIANQLKLGIDYAKSINIEYQEYIDEGYSATGDDIEDRPNFARFLSDIANGTITHIFAFDQSRFERNPKVRFVITKIFKDYNVVYYTHLDGLVDINDPQVELFGDMQSLFNKYHVTITRIKVKSVLKQRAEEGKSHGISPYGYTKDADGKITVDKEEAAIVKTIYSLSLSGMGTRSIASELNKKNVPTRYNKIEKGTLKIKNKYTKEERVKNKSDIKWSGNTIRNIIVNTIYKGDRVYNKEIQQVPSIIDIDYWQKVNDNLAKNANNTGKKVIHRYLLKGLIRCSVCGRNMYGRTRVSKKDNYYMCSSKRLENENCGNRSINIDKLDNFIWENLFSKKDFIDRLETQYLFNKNGVNLLESDIQTESKTLKALSSQKQKAIKYAFENEFENDVEFKSEMIKLNNKIKETEIKLQDLQVKYNSIIEGENLIKKLKGSFSNYTKITSFSQKQEIVNSYIKNIYVEYVSDSYYSIDIEYQGQLGIENWKTPNYKANNFYTIKAQPDGSHVILVSSPSPISNPDDKSNLEKFKKSAGDFVMVSNKVKTTYKAKTKKN